MFWETIYLLPYLTRKVTRLSYWTSIKTKREGKPQASQIKSFFKPASLVLTVKDTHIYLGSGYNAVQAKDQEDQWSLRINCAGTELVVPGAYALPLEDTNDVKLTAHKQVLDRIAFLCSDIIDAKASSNVEEYPKKILFNCWVGASRSVACLIYILDNVLTSDEQANYNTETPEERFTKLYNTIQRERPCVCISSALKQQVIAMMTN
jgi:hypothetical protein